MDEDDQKLQHYLEIGAIELEGVDENGEVIYSISEKAKEIAPELWESHKEWVDKALLDLYESGLISVDYNEDLEATINLSPEGYDRARDLGLIELDIDKDIPNN
jgi:hypothetical protein